MAAVSASTAPLEGLALRVLSQAVQLDFPVWERVSQLGRHGLALSQRDSFFGLVSNLWIEIRLAVPTTPFHT